MGSSPYFDAAAGFLAGYVDGSSEMRAMRGDIRLKTVTLFIIQDSFHLAPTLTLNYGLRWDYFGVMGEKNNLLSNVTNYELNAATFSRSSRAARLQPDVQPDHRNSPSA